MAANRRDLGMHFKCLNVSTAMRNSADFWFTDEIEQRQVQTSKGPVEYAEVGQGIPVLYFHGNDVGNDAAVMLEKSLIDDGFRLIVPNRPGYYGTPLTCGKSPNDCADLAADLLDQLHVERVVVIGTSGGGPAASRFAARHSQRTIALVLQCALSHPFDSGRWMPRGLGWLLPVFHHLSIFIWVLRLGHRKQSRKLGSGEFVSACMSKDRFAELRETEELQSLGSLLGKSMLRCSEWQAGIENDWASWTGEPWLTPDSVSCPTLILHDRADTVVPIAHAEWAMYCIPGAQFCELHTGGHLIWVGRDHEKMHRRPKVIPESSPRTVQIATAANPSHQYRPCPPSVPIGYNHPAAAWGRKTWSIMSSGFLILSDGRCLARRWFGHDAVVRAVAEHLDDSASARDLREWLLSLLPGPNDEEHIGYGPWLRVSDQLVIERFLDLRELTDENQRLFCQAAYRAGQWAQSAEGERLETGIRDCILALADMVARADRGELPLSRSEWTVVEPSKGRHIGPGWNDA